MGVIEILVEDARQEGIEKGIEKGIEEGIEQHTIDVITNILKAFPEWADDKIADLAATTKDMVAKIRISLYEK